MFWILCVGLRNGYFELKSGCKILEFHKLCLCYSVFSSKGALRLLFPTLVKSEVYKNFLPNKPVVFL